MAFTPKQEQYKSKAGNDYTFQNVPNSKHAEIMDDIVVGGDLKTSRIMKNMLEHVIVQPQGLTMDDFDDWNELDEVTGAAYKFLKTGQLPISTN